MIKLLKRSASIIVGLVIAVSVLSFPTSAAARAIIAFSNSKPAVSQTVAVKVTIDGGEALYGVEFNLSYKSDILEYVNTDCDAISSAGAGNIKASPALTGKTKVTYTFNFKALNSGSATIAVSGMASGVENDLTFAASAPLVVADATKSDDATLSALSLDVGTISPAFSANKTSYTATVNKETEVCTVYATTTDPNATVAIVGNSGLKAGVNNCSVTVTAPSGKQKVYRIKITRPKADEVTSEPTEPTEPTEPETPVANPYEANIDGTVYTIATDITGVALPNGFNVTTTDYNGVNVAVAADYGDNYKIYYLKSAEATAYTPYVLNSDGATFEKLKYAVIGNNTYIFANIPTGMTAPKDYYETTVKIGDFEVKGFAHSGDTSNDFYYIYCFFDTGFRTYRYDSEEGVIQRFPEFKLVEETQNSSPKSTTFMDKFNSLSSNAKIIVVGLVIAILLAIALITLSVIRIINSRTGYYDDFEEESVFGGGFDEVVINDTNEAQKDTAEKE